MAIPSQPLRKEINFIEGELKAPEKRGGLGPTGLM